MRIIRLAAALTLAWALLATAAEAHTKTFNSEIAYISTTNQSETGFFAVTGRIVGNPQCIADRAVRLIVYSQDSSGRVTKEVADVGRSGRNGYWSVGTVLGPETVVVDLVAPRKRLPTRKGHRHFCAGSKFPLI